MIYSFILFLTFVIAIRASIDVPIRAPITEPSWISLCPSQNSEYNIVQSKDTSCIAYGYMSNELQTTGWDILEIHTNQDFSDTEQSKAMGFLEGYLHAATIQTHAYNMYFDLFNSLTIPAKVDTFLNSNWDWTQQQAHANSGTSDYWNQVELLIHQFHGVVAGVKHAGSKITVKDLLVVQLVSDIEDIETRFGYELGSETRTKRRKAREHKKHRLTNSTNAIFDHCSAIFQFTPNKDDIMFAHNTWGSYPTMMRTFKKLYTNFGGKSQVIHFSSYPGSLYSNDDYYMNQHSGLLISETTNGIYRESLYSNLTPSSNMVWIRAMAANYLANDPQDWTIIFAQYNSGTYNCQWMVLNTNNFVSGKDLPDGSFWIIEQYPGGSQAGDVTSVLNQQGYWTSYNVPYFPDVFKKIGYAKFETIYGAYYFGYKGYFRDLIFSRDIPNVKDFTQFKTMMLKNEWKTDKYAQNDSCFALSGRFDLAGPDPVPDLGEYERAAYGGIDLKATTVKMFRNGLSTHIISGPAHVSADTPPFSWSQNNNEWKDIVHTGMPETYDFDWVDVKQN